MKETYLKPEELVAGTWYKTNELRYTFRFTRFEEVGDTIRIHYDRYIQGASGGDKKDWFANQQMVDTISLLTDFETVRERFPEDIPTVNNSYSII